jgi:hypothetical protein
VPVREQTQGLRRVEPDGRLVEELHDLAPQPISAHTSERAFSQRGAQRTARSPGQREPEPGREARRPEGTGGVVVEAAPVQDAQRTALEIAHALRRIHDAIATRPRLRRQRQGERVDREVAAQQVFLEGPGLDLRERPRMRVALAPRGREIQRGPLPREHDGPEAIVSGGAHPFALEAPRELLGAARILDQEIDIAHLAPEEPVPHRPTHQVDGELTGLGRPEHRPDELAERPGQVGEQLGASAPPHREPLAARPRGCRRSTVSRSRAPLTCV